MPVRYKTIEEYIDEFYFYHITNIENRESILINGLSSESGTYVVRSDSTNVAKCIFDQYVVADYNGDPLNLSALIIGVNPNLNQITKSDIRIDHAINSPVLKIQNIIMKRDLIILENDISIINWRVSDIDYSDIDNELENHPDELKFYNPEEQNWRYVSRTRWDNEWIKIS